ncbi:hypothetical protein ASE19_00235 [Nocardioides sp. Root79]|nr:hypothetical protein ASE19_00235 [Nocardioides sp. Root79]KRC68670.1 hypothetical protein ASE20_17730 [Nocardioides sp. Root240]
MKLNKYVGGSIAALAAAAIAVGSVLPAQADPTRPYAAAGSDTIQDVWNALTNDGAASPFGDIASYDAFDGSGVAADTVMIKPKTLAPWVTRPSGSGDGVKSLSASWNSANHIFKTKDLFTSSAIDFARSSGGPSVSGSALTFIPFARDAVSIAFNPTTGLTSLDLTTAQIKELYSGVDDSANSVVTFVSGQPQINGVAVHPKLPQAASGTRKFFLAAAGVTALASYVDGAATFGENNGTFIPNDGDLVPFSAGQWIAQANGQIPGLENTTTGLALAAINGQAAVNGTAPTITPGALYGTATLGNYTAPPATGVGAFSRDTYDVIPTQFLSGTPKQANLVAALTSGLNGASQKTTIKKYGFGTLSYLTDASKYLSSAYTN